MKLCFAFRSEDTPFIIYDFKNGINLCFDSKHEFELSSNYLEYLDRNCLDVFIGEILHIPIYFLI